MRELINLVTSSPDAHLATYGRRSATLVLRVAPAIAIAVWMVACAGACGWALGRYLVEALP